MPPTDQTSSSLKLNVLFYGIFLAVARFIFIRTFHQDVSVQLLSNEFFPPPHIAGIAKSYIYWTVFISLLITLILFYLASAIVQNSDLKMFVKNRLYKQGVFPLLIILYAGGMFFQVPNHARYFAREQKDFRGKTLKQKKQMMFRFVYAFAEQVHQKIPGEHTARIITDFDIDRSSEMTLHRQLCYFMYPINIRSHPEDQAPDVLIFFGKKNAARAVPPGYKLVERYDDENMAAVKIQGTGP